MITNQKKKAAKEAAHDKTVKNTLKAVNNQPDALQRQHTGQPVSPEPSSEYPEVDWRKRFALGHCADAIALILMNFDVRPLEALLETTMKKLREYVRQV